MRTFRSTPKMLDDDERDDAGDRGHGHDAGPEVEPAGEPAERPVGQPLRPLVDRPGDREVAGQLGEDQGDERLAQDDDRPRPEERPGRRARCRARSSANEPVETLMKLNASAKFDRNPSERCSSGLMPSERRWASSRAATSCGLTDPATISSSYRRAAGRGTDRWEWTRGRRGRPPCAPSSGGGTAARIAPRARPSTTVFVGRRRRRRGAVLAARPRLRVEAVEAERVVLDRQDREAAEAGLPRDRLEGGGPQDRARPDRRLVGQAVGQAGDDAVAVEEPLGLVARAP